MFKPYKPVLCVIMILLLAGCSRSFEVIRDIRELPQDHHHYIPEATADRDLVSADDLAGLQRNYNRNYFAPWHQDRPVYGRDAVLGFFQGYLKKLDDGKKNKRAAKSFSKKVATNARLDHYPNAAIRAMTIRHADMRGLPTDRVFPPRKGRPSSGVVSPFDRLQVSSIPVNLPVFISHVSKDRKWGWAETGSACGWVMIRDLAPVDDDFMKKWESGTYAVFVKDNVRLLRKKDHHMKASIGALFPMVGQHADQVDILVATSGKKGKAVVHRTPVSAAAAVSTPHALNLRHLTALANELVDNPYGWGGKGEKRDCSSMIRDLFAPFGLWLPRHSADQASEGGQYVDLSGLNREEKQSAILAQGVPYLTLLWFKGHIMLYIGAKDGEPLVFHNFWSVRTEDIEGRAGKRIIGRAAITTLHPGRELQPPGSSRGDLLEAIQGMTLLLHPAAPNVVAGRGLL